jgi:hypothetical protein
VTLWASHALAQSSDAARKAGPDVATVDTVPVTPMTERAVHRGADRRLDVAPPRVEADIAVDGRLDEAVWQRAALLTAFSQYNPVDGRPARDSSEVLVWYSPTAIHFGIRAFSTSGVQATLADRDRIGNDDLFQILIDTFHDRRRAFVFAVNPFGIQTDGMRSEQGAQPGVSRAGLGAVDLTQDYIWQSKGRLTDYGYEVELRIPFKSIRFQSADTQTWGLQIIRQTQRTGYQDTWAPASRGNASFLVQEGRLNGMTGLQRGLVMDVTPVVTSFVNGAPTASAADAWRYTNRQQFGGDVRWGVTSNFTLNGTANPDFSQVEADVGQIPGDVRFALFFPELRPFFVEGSEQFDAPNRLVYTRQIVRPVSAVKLTGKIPRTDVGVLAAIDQAAPGVVDAPNPLFAIARVRRDLGDNSTAGALFTDREAGQTSNRVLNADARLLFGRVYTLDLQAAGSQDVTTSGTRRGTLLDLAHGRTGRQYGYRYSLQSISPDFITRSGFVPRNDFVRAQIFNRGSFFGKRGARIEQYTLFFQSSALWTSNDFSDRAPPLETRIGISNSVTLKGGWQASVTPEWQTFAFDPRRYTSYFVLQPSGARVDTTAFAVNARQSMLGAQFRLTAPQRQRWGWSVQLSLGEDPEFFETATVRRIDLDASADWRPTPQIRINALLRRQQFDRERDGTRFSTRTIPRLRVEYQATRQLFFRFVGQYESSVRDALRDPRSDQPVVLRSSTGTFSRATAVNTNGMRADWLLSFLPNPGTVFFAGYGASLTDGDPFAFRNVERTNDGFFVKFSYLYRVGQATR